MAAQTISETYRLAPHGEIHFIAGRRKSDGVLSFPLPDGREASLYEAVELPSRGTLWSFTIQRFCPKPPYAGTKDSFAPYAVGYVEFPNGVIIEARLAVEDFSTLSIDMRLQAVLAPFKRADGSVEMIPMFADAGAPQ